MGTRPLVRSRIEVRISDQAANSLLLSIAALFMLVGIVLLYLAPYPLTLTSRHLLAVGSGWFGAWGSVHYLLRRRLARYDPIIVSLVAMLTGWGLLLQARVAPALLYRQVLWLLIGCAVLVATALTAQLTRILRRYRYLLLTAGIVLLGATLVFGVNPSGYGQELWLGAFGLYIQPSEPLKLLLIIYLAAYLADRRDLPAVKAAGEPMWLIVLGPMVAMVGLALLLLGWQQDLGAAILFYLTFVAMIYLAWGNGRYVLLSLVLFVPVALAGYVLSDRVALRFSIWLDPWAPEQADRAFQILQSLFAIGAGGLFGQGLGQGAPTLIPAVHTDFVYAAIAEEFGLVGALGLLLLITALVARAIRIAQQSESAFGSLAAGGIAAWIGIQTFVITGGNAELIPITGVTLPFMSLGGSSLVTMLGAAGLLLNLSAPHPVAMSLSLAPDANRPIKATAARLGQILVALLSSVALITGLWSLVRAEALQGYPGNPRFIVSESRIRRGRILDRNAEVLAAIETDAQGFVTRTYPVAAAAPVVGYATLAYGTDGIEGACDARLRGEAELTPWASARQKLLHIDPVGRDVRLTLNSQLQTRAQESLAEYVGSVVVVDTRTGEVLALASSPVYTSATVTQDWPALSAAVSSPFLNRATQALAQPGTSLQPFILASALQRDPSWAPMGEISRTIAINGTAVGCRIAPSDLGWQALLTAGCPAPFAEVARQLGNSTFTEEMARWGFLDAPGLTIPTVAVDLGQRQLDAWEDGLGQGELLVTPLQMVQAMAALGNDGVRPDLHLLETQLVGCAEPAEPNAERVIDAEIADQTRRLLSPYAGTVGHLGISLAGHDRVQAWFAGLNSASVPRYAVVVFLDEVRDPKLALSIGVDLMQNLATR